MFMGMRIDGELVPFTVIESRLNDPKLSTMLGYYNKVGSDFLFFHVNRS